MENKIIWLTGLPCSGKTTIANKLASLLSAEVLDGDDIRKFMKNSDFSLEGRKKHMLSVAEIAYRFSKYAPVVVSLVSPIREVREEIKRKYPNVVEVHVDCSLEECEKRDVKGMYALARKGSIKNFTGIDAPYEAPEESIVVNSEKQNVNETVKEILFKANLSKDKYSLFIGRWQCLPPHEGHLKLFDVVRKEGKKILIAVRDTEVDDKNPYSVKERIEAIKEVVPDAKIIILPDIEEVCYGRGVGYGIREIRLEYEIEKISGTKIRKKENDKI